MKKLYALLFSVFSYFVFSQSPQSINYQGVVRDQTGVPITTLSSIGVKFAISDGSNAIVHQETQSSVGVNNVGLFNTRIGISPALSSTISWQNGPYTLSVSIDLGSGFTFLGSQQMVSVPFALYAERAGNAQAQNLTLNGNNLSISGGNTVTLPAGGTPTITGTGASTVSSAGNSFTVNTPAVNISSGAGATVSGAFPNYTISGGAGSTPTITGTGANNVITAGNSFTVNAPTVNISGTGGSTVTGAFPNYTVTSLAGVPPTIVGAGASTVTPVGNSFTVNTPAVNIAGVGGSSVSGTFPNFTVSSLAGANPTIVGMGATTVIPVGNSFTVNTPTVNITGTGGSTVTGTFPNYVVAAPINSLSGDVIGSFLSNTVTALRGFSLAPISPTLGQILSFIGGAWTPTTPPSIPIPIWLQYPGYVSLYNNNDFVGLGTGTVMPQAKLEISNGSASDGLRINDSGTSDGLHIFKTSAGGFGAEIYMGSANNSTGLSISHLGGGSGISVSTGTGQGIFANSSGSLHTIYSANNSTGSSVRGTKSAISGHAGWFDITNGSSSDDAILGQTAGTGYAIRAANSNAATTSYAGYFDGGLVTKGKSALYADFSYIAKDNTGSNVFTVRNNGFTTLGANVFNASKLNIEGSDNTTNFYAYAGSPSSGITINNLDATSNNFSSVSFAGGGVESAKIVGVHVNHTVGSNQGDMVLMTRSPANINEVMRLTSAGNVGIGTSAPTNLLHVNGSVKITDGTQGAGKVFTSDAAGVGSWQNPSPKVAFNAGTNPVANQVVPGAVVTTVQFGAGNNYFNDGGGYNTGTYQFTPPSAGVYEMATFLSLQGTAGAVLQVWISSPGGWFARSQETIPNTGNTIVHISATVNSTVCPGPWYVQVYSNSPLTVLPYDSGFSGHRVY